jgi:hypothetical protein
MSDWIKHDGRASPVSEAVLVDIKYRDGQIMRHVSTPDWIWVHSKALPSLDIVAYKISEASHDNG